MQNVGRISLKGLDLLFPLSLLVLNDVLLALDLSWTLDLGFHVDGFLTLVLPFQYRAVHLLLSFLVHDLIRVIVQVLLLLDLFWMINNHVGFKVKFRHIHSDVVLVVVHSLVHILLNLVFKVSVDRVAEQVLPLNSLFRVDYQHFSDDVLSYLRDLVNAFWEV